MKVVGRSSHGGLNNLSISGEKAMPRYVAQE